MALETNDIISNTFSANTLSATTFYLGNTSITNVFAPNIQGGYLPLSGGTVTGGTNFNSELSASTIISGSTNLYNIFQQIGQAGTTTNVQSGTNILTGGTALNPTINLTSSPSVNNLTVSGTSTNIALSATTLSASTIISGSTNLYNIFQQINTSVQGVQPGTNILTGGTSLNPTVNLVSSPSVNNLTVSGITSLAATTATTLSATSISGVTIFLGESPTPSNPISGATIYVKNVANRRMSAQNGPSGIDYVFQPSLSNNKVSWWNPPGNSTTVPGVLGFPALTATGTATARNVATTNMFTRTKRLALVSAATAGSLAGFRLALGQYTVGDGAGLGGFTYVVRFGIGDAVTTTRTFVGLRSVTTAPTNVEPSGLTNSIGVGNGIADTTFHIYYGGSVAQTPIDLGANFPCNTNNSDLYELTLFSPPNFNNIVSYKFERVNTGNIASGLLTGVAGTAIPASTTLLGQNDYRTNNAVLTAVSLEYVSIYSETDN